MFLLLIFSVAVFQNKVYLLNPAQKTFSSLNIAGQAILSNHKKRLSFKNVFYSFI